jgi:CHAD domain-containing protein
MATVQADRQAAADLGSDRSTLHSRLRARIGEQLQQLRERDCHVRTDRSPEDVHKMRVAVRRLRALLRTTRPALDRAWADSLRDELAWLADSLGAVRDLDVMSARLTSQAAPLNGGDAVVAGQLLQPLRIERERLHRELVADLDSDRYRALLDWLETAASSPPLHRDRKPKGLAAKEYRRLTKRGPIPPDASNPALHKKRIRIKRARYAAEFAQANPGKPARRFIAAATKLQDILGEHQDAVVARRRLRDLARQSGSTGAALVAGRLIEIQERRAAKARRKLDKAWRRLERHGKEAWTS